MIFQSILGLAVFHGIAWLFSEGRRRVDFPRVAMGLALQIVLALLLLKLPFFREGFLHLNRLVLALEAATAAGTGLVFGYLGGASLPFQESAPGSSFILAFRALPLVLVISALSALLYHWRILPYVVGAFAWVLQKTMRVGGAVGLSAAANIFVGMVEAPLLVRPYLLQLSRGELFIVMTCGMATVAGTVMVLYANILGAVAPDALGHILTASIISAPAAITVARIMVPDEEAQSGSLKPAPPDSRSAFDAITSGTMQGLQLFWNIIAMLIVLVALVALVNLGLGLLPDIAGAPLTLQRLMGWLMVPVVWLMGVPWSEAPVAGALMGTKTVLNELIAYLDLVRLPADALSPSSRLIMIYAMCGFANPGRLGIMIGGIGAIVPERRDEIIALGLKSIFAGTLATCIPGRWWG